VVSIEKSFEIGLRIETSDVILSFFFLLRAFGDNQTRLDLNQTNFSC